MTATSSCSASPSRRTRRHLLSASGVSYCELPLGSSPASCRFGYTVTSLEEEATPSRPVRIQVRPSLRRRISTAPPSASGLIDLLHEATEGRDGPSTTRTGSSSLNITNVFFCHQSANRSGTATSIISIVSRQVQNAQRALSANGCRSDDPNSIFLLRAPPAAASSRRTAGAGWLIYSRWVAQKPVMRDRNIWPGIAARNRRRSIRTARTVRSRSLTGSRSPALAIDMRCLATTKASGSLRSTTNFFSAPSNASTRISVSLAG
jgi:hypothetical protein